MSRAFSKTPTTWVFDTTVRVQDAAKEYTIVPVLSFERGIIPSSASEAVKRKEKVNDYGNSAGLVGVEKDFDEGGQGDHRFADHLLLDHDDDDDDERDTRPLFSHMAPRMDFSFSQAFAAAMALGAERDRLAQTTGDGVPATAVEGDAVDGLESERQERKLEYRIVPMHG